MMANEYFCVSLNEKAQCLVCSESIATLKECNTAKRCNSKHKDKYKNCVGSLRKEKMAA